MEKNELKKGVSLVRLNNICSQDYYYLGDNKARAVLKDISFEVNAGEVFGISSYNDEEIKILTEIVANIRPYFSGTCSLGEFGMLSQKKMVIPHLYYIDSYSTLYNNMTVIEYLMFVTEKSIEKNPAIKQKNLLDMLIDFGLGYVSLSLIEVLTIRERVILEYIIAYLSKNAIVVANFTDFDFNDEEIQIIKKITSKIIKDNERCVIVSTHQAKLIGIVCSNTIFIVDGKTRYVGGVNQLIARFDPVKVIIIDSRKEEMFNLLKKTYPEFSFEMEREMILVKDEDNKFSINGFLKKLIDNNIDPDSIKINRGRVQNSFEEVARNYDLPK